MSLHDSRHVLDIHPSNFIELIYPRSQHYCFAYSVRPLKGDRPSLLPSHLSCPSQAQVRKSWPTGLPLHDRTLSLQERSRGISALGSLSSFNLGSYASCKSQKSLRNGTYTLARALSRGSSARSPLTTRSGLICGLQQSMVVLSYGFVYHDFRLPALDPPSQHQAPYSIHIRLRILALQVQLMAWFGRELRPQAPLTSD